MERIASFSVDHTKLPVGMYLSRTDFGDIDTYDVRMKAPNAGEYLSTGAAHTFEHLFATYARNSRFGPHVVYIGPMGCRTGCYLLVKGLPRVDAIALAREAMEFVRDFTGEIPGAKLEECGNYQDHDLPAAKRVAAEMAETLRGWTEEQLQYAAYLA
ncbi:S-ribosylhomocysteine lyase [Ruminococcaceae bacterium OttesenSCG-928-O06]|nr:S-ribosylhomocysteine lyase [Ruminococcaceae bacterium OttesenSCG-928-O06]